MMHRGELLRSIAETGYNVGFGAKKNFATYDIVQKAPGLIGFVSLAAGILALIYQPLSSKWIAVFLLLLGIVNIYVTNYDHNKDAYRAEGVRLTAIFYHLRDLYRDVKAMVDDDSVTEYRERYDALQSELFSSNQSNQILFSDWYAHYKFFWQHQIEWIDEQKQFKLWRDKVPLSFTFAILILGLMSISAFIIWIV